MRSPFVHVVDVALEPSADPRAIGGAVTVELCGHWEHAPPCRWPHHTSVERTGDAKLAARILFACEPSEEAEVRRRIDQRVRSGRLQGPDGVVSQWRLLGATTAAPTQDERTRAAAWC